MPTAQLADARPWRAPPLYAPCLPPEDKSSDGSPPRWALRRRAARASLASHRRPYSLWLAPPWRRLGWHTDGPALSRCCSSSLSCSPRPSSCCAPLCCGARSNGGRPHHARARRWPWVRRSSSTRTARRCGCGTPRRGGATWPIRLSHWRCVPPDLGVALRQRHRGRRAPSLRRAVVVAALGARPQEAVRRGSSRPGRCRYAQLPIFLAVGQRPHGRPQDLGRAVEPAPQHQVKAYVARAGRSRVKSHWHRLRS